MTGPRRDPASPLSPPAGGIRARSHGGPESWWAIRWLDLLEREILGTRLARGRGYARSGRVTELAVGDRRVEAQVQGSRDAPYSVEIVFRALPPAAREELSRHLRRQPLVAAKLLAGELPRSLEETFEQIGSPLFPLPGREAETRCACPERTRACKHVAAVYYLLAEEVERDPLLLLELRGSSRERLLGDVVGEADGGAEGERRPTAEPLPVDAGGFWRGRPLPEGLYGHLETPEPPAPLLRRLGAFPFWQAEALVEALAPVYEAASKRSLELFLAPEERGEDEAPDADG